MLNLIYLKIKMPRPRRTVNIKKERESKMEGFEELEQETESSKNLKLCLLIKTRPLKGSINPKN